MRFATVYGYAKEGSGELRSSIKTLEETVKSLVGPVNDKFRLVPDEILRHVDTDQNQNCVVHESPTVSEVTTRLFNKCEPVAEQCVTSAWERLKRSPMFTRMANTVVHKAEYCTEKYNGAIVATAEKGCRVSAYLPLVHTEGISVILKCE